MTLRYFFLFMVMAFRANARASAMLLLLMSSIACGAEKEVPIDTIAALRLEYGYKLAELEEKTKNNIGGWPSDHDCDGALWAGIARAAGADWVDVSAALRPDGRPTRRPLFDCGPGNLGYNDGSATTTSNDMITGIILGLYTARDADSVLRLYQYGEQHKWIMGYPEYYISRVLLRPNGITLIARILYELSNGQRDYVIRLAPVVYGPVQSDYEQHLILLSRYLEKKIGGPQYGMEIAEKILAKSLPLDALAQAVSGNYLLASLLLTGNYQSPTYVRGHENYHLVHWLISAKVVLDGVAPEAE